ncbi:hypothetical protein E1162_15150, partial [Rhodobacteraceae bacterium RKSG542]|uniref:hypothetical protein n=1 Tax=Pseudovibrio flavus TaxID=2529854 RepID=UPI00211BE36B
MVDSTDPRPNAPQQNASAGPTDQIITFPSGTQIPLTDLNAQQLNEIKPVDGKIYFPTDMFLGDAVRLGDDLLFRQPDGSISIVKDGAVAGYDYFVGDEPVNMVILPDQEEETGEEEETATTEASEGDLSDVSDSSGANFDQVNVLISPAFPISPLLPPTEFGFPELEERELFDALDLPRITLGLDDGAGVDIFGPLGSVTGFEDADGPGDSGVTIDLSLRTGVSFGSSSVTIDFGCLPEGAVVSVGTLSEDGVWTGSTADANELQIYFPGDFSGTIDATVTVNGDGVSESGPLTIIVEPTPDVEIEASPITATETDGPLPIKPADFINITQTDGDGSEVIESVTITLTGLPSGTTTNFGSISADGTLTFTGTPEEFEELCLVFPQDFSTENPGTTISGTVTASSNEGEGPELPITIDIAFEGDVEVGVTDQ